MISIIMGGYQIFMEKLDDLQQRINQISGPVAPSTPDDKYAYLEPFSGPSPTMAPIPGQNPTPTVHEIKYCSINHDHDQAGCTAAGACNYPHPKKMSQLDRNLFLIKYPKDMTPQDYIHWLYAHDDPLTLEYIDYQNYRNRTQGKLIWENIRHIYQQTMIPFSDYHRIGTGMRSIPLADHVLLPGADI